MRAALVVAGLVALACLPLPSSAPVRAALAAEGVLLAGAGLWARWRRIPPASLLPAATTEPEDGRRGGGLSARAALWTLVAITGLALVLRLVQLDSDLWLDEIVTVDDYAELSVGAIFSTYDDANNHLLNSLLVHVAIAAFGYEEWAIRLPAVVAGVLTIPAFYWVARTTFGRAASLLAALAVAVSYHHVFFSQNARGYALSLLFGLLATALLVRGLRTDALWSWGLYAVAAVLCVASVPTGAFVLAGHVAVVVAALVAVRSRGAAPALARRAAAVYAVVVLVLAQLYAPVVSDAAAVAEKAWKQPDAGFDPLSLEFVDELLDAVSARGPLAAAVAVVAALVGLAGVRSFARRDWALLAGLSLGPFLHVAFIVARGLAFSPRFLVGLLFPAVLVAVETLRVLQGRVGMIPRVRASRRRHLSGAVAAGGAVVLCAALAAPLASYYRIPKQPFREAVGLAVSLRDGGVVVPIYTARSGVRYYGVQHPEGERLVEGETVRYARTASALRRISYEAGGRRIVLVTTFPRALHLGRPRLEALVAAGWKPAASFPGSIGDADVTVWLPVTT